MAESWNDKDCSENRLSSFTLLLQYEGGKAKTSSPATASSLML